MLIRGINDLQIADRYAVIGSSLDETIESCIRLMITRGHRSIYDEEWVDRCAVNESLLLYILTFTIVLSNITHYWVDNITT